MTDIFRVPLIASHDYDVLRALIPDAPSTHHEWAELFRRRTMEERRRGSTIHEIHVDPHKFAADARRKGDPTNFATLERYLLDTDPHCD
ncbi:MAG: hypothetical protein ACK4HG_00175 [Agrobacterium albertimagni]